MDIKKRIQELSLDQKAKLYFMGLVRQGKIDRLPEDPKAAYVSMMMDKDDYGRSISGKDKRTFMEPEDSMPAARARKLAGMEDDEMETRYDYDDPIFENYDKQSLLKALGSADDALIQTHVSPDPLGRGYEKGAGPDGDFGYGDYRLDGQEYLIYNPNSNNKDSAAMWNSNDYVVALDKDGEKYKIAYSDIMRINSYINEGDTYEKMAAKGKKAGNLKQGTVRKRLRIKDGEKIPLARINKAISGLKKRKSLSDKDKKYLKALNLAKTLKTTTNIKEIATELGYLKEEDRFAGFADKPTNKKDYVGRGLDKLKRAIKKPVSKDPELNKTKLTSYQMGQLYDFKLLRKNVSQMLDVEVDDSVRSGIYNGREGYNFRISSKDLKDWSKEQIEKLKQAFKRTNSKSEDYEFEYNGVSNFEVEPGERNYPASFDFFATRKK